MPQAPLTENKDFRILVATFAYRGVAHYSTCGYFRP